MFNILMTVMIAVGVVVSFCFLFFPRRVVVFLLSSRVWMWYLDRVFNIKKVDLLGDRALWLLRIQGAIILPLALSALLAWL